MQPKIDYNFLIIGRSGSGKSATTKLLTRDPSIAVANSINEITTQVQFHQGCSHTIGSDQVSFGILDIPGLDRIANRFQIRQRILQQLEKLKISLHGIIYVASLTERDTIDQSKLFHFIDQLPWDSFVKKSALIPILTKYDNFVIDSPDEDISRTKDEFQTMFTQNGYKEAWAKRVYWVNYTKSLEFKMKINEDIRDKFQNQIQRLTMMAKKNRKPLLTAEAIRDYIESEDRFVVDGFLKKITGEEIPYAMVTKKHRIPLQVKLSPNRLQQNLTAVSLSSIGMVLSRALKRDIPAPISLLMMGIPLTLTLINIVKPHQDSPEKISCCEPEEPIHKIMQNYNGVCCKIDRCIQEEWKEVNKNINFVYQGNTLQCRFDPSLHYNFFSLENFTIRDESSEKGELFQKVNKNDPNKNSYQIHLPKMEQDDSGIWNPIMEIEYQVKAFDETMVMKAIQNLRQKFNGQSLNINKPVNFFNQ